MNTIENTFYDEIDPALLQHNDLCSFAKILDNNVNIIKTNLQSISKIYEFASSTPNINYAQLQNLSIVNKYT
jgi:hypothetical protein